MARQGWQICRDCNQLAMAGSPYCESHQQNNREKAAAREREDRRREFGLKALYDGAAWKRTRAFILARDPFCIIGALCGGQSFSVDVDHIIRAEVYIGRHGGQVRYFYDPANLRGACHACHAYKTALENRGRWIEPDSPPHPPIRTDAAEELGSVPNTDGG